MIQSLHHQLPNIQSFNAATISPLERRTRVELKPLAFTVHKQKEHISVAFGRGQVVGERHSSAHKIIVNNFT